MLISVDLNDHPRTEAAEVRDVRADRDLSSKVRMFER
jgi:hypothetical protein